MKKRYLGLLMAVLAAGLLTGCESISEVTNTVSEKLGLTDTETETELQDGQRKATIQVVSITGNELTYVELEEETESETEDAETAAEEETGEESEFMAEDETDEESESVTEDGTEEESEGITEAESDNEAGMEMPSMDGGEMPDMGNMDMSDSSGGEMPEMSDFPGSDMADSNAAAGSDSTDEEAADLTETESETEEIAAEEADTEAGADVFSPDDRSSMQGRGQMGGGMGMSDMAEAFGDMDMSDIEDAISGGDIDMSDIEDAMSNADDLSDLVSELTQETVTVYLPVGVVVYTDTGKEKTFSILEAGDELEVLFETDADGNEVITKMWLTGTE
ncbi:MAG: hypothetical protein LUH07_15255 [Lachnospiraceae bacterium]|nr:hypothetical protein [Lachnospiraceae bacterium]